MGRGRGGGRGRAPPMTTNTTHPQVDYLVIITCKQEQHIEKHVHNVLRKDKRVETLTLIDRIFVIGLELIKSNNLKATERETWNCYTKDTNSSQYRSFKVIRPRGHVNRVRFHLFGSTTTNFVTFLQKWAFRIKDMEDLREIMQRRWGRRQQSTQLCRRRPQM